MADYNFEEVIQNILSDLTCSPIEKIPLVVKEIELIKADLKTYLNDSNQDLVAILKESTNLYAEGATIVEELKMCETEIEKETIAEILHSIENYEAISKELKCIEFALNLVLDVSQCGKFVKHFDEGQETESFTKAIEAVASMLKYLDAPSEGFKQMDICTNTKNTAQEIMDNLIRDLHNEWSRLMQWKVAPEIQKTVISLIILLDTSLPVLDVLIALENTHLLKGKIVEFSKFLLNDILMPTIYEDCMVHPETEELVTVIINHLANFRPEYSDVMLNLNVFFDYLSSVMNITFGNGMNLMSLIGKEIGIAFTEILVKDCLINTVPNNVNELKDYGKIIKEIENFQEFLTKINFFPSDKISILDYINDIDTLFSNKTSQYFLDSARKIMIKDLSVSMSIGVDVVPDEEEIAQSNENINAVQVLNRNIPKSLFYFPRCMISKTTQELLDLVYMMVEQAVMCPDVVCKKLYNSTRLVFELYDAVVPYYHENFLHTIPQYVALFHNNCMYLAHHLLTLGDKWVTLMEGRKMDFVINFVDLVQKLRDLGHRHLAIHMQQQRKQIWDNIRSSDLNCIVVKDVLGENAEAAVRQCLRQLQLLKNVWIGVFPLNVFTRLMATLVSMFVDELIHRVCTVEDISMEMATQLTEMYTLVVQKSPLLFQSPTDIDTYVPSWPKLAQLIYVLGGSLKDIENGWQDGNGPLKVFKTEELRNLVKALFQNTQIRANLLTKIK